jgi:hypothetical protein
MDWTEGLDEGAIKIVDRFCEGDGDERDINVAKLAKGYTELHTKFSSSPKIPSEDADEKQWNDFYNKLGRPEKAESYEFKKDKLPEDYPWDEGFEKSMKEVAHKAGINTKQFSALAEKFLEYNGTSYLAANEASQKAVETALGELKETWKDDYEQNVNIAKHAVKAVDNEDEEITKYLESTGLGDDPVFIKLFHNIGLKILDDTLVQGIQTNKTGKPKKGQFEPEFSERYGTGDNS